MLVINIDFDSLAKGSYDLITGKINVNFDGFIFPEQEWNDFVVVIMTWWLDSLNKLMFSNSQKEKFKFMDGPFYFEISKFNADFQIHFYHRENLIKIFTVSTNNFNDTLISVATSLNTKCLLEKWETEDLTHLRNSLNKFEY